MKRILFAILIAFAPQALGQVVPLDEDTAYTLPVNMLPLVDSNGDIDETIAYNEAGMELYWNFITEAGVYTVTQVTPTTGGVYDWTHVDGGHYSMEIPASGGASANNDTAGTGWWTGKSDGVLVFSSPHYSFSVFGSVADTATEVETELNDRLPNATATTNLNTAFADTLAEPTDSSPDANAALWVKIGYLYAALRNKVTVTATEKTYYDDADAELWDKELSDDGSVYTETEGATAD